MAYSIRWLLAGVTSGFLIGPAAASCEATYYPTLDSLQVPCVSVYGSDDRYALSFQQGASGTITVQEARQLSLSDTAIDDIQFVSSPFPVAVVMYSLGNGCMSLYEPTTMEWSGDGRAVTIKMRTNTYYHPAALCTQAVVSGAKAFVLSSYGLPVEPTEYTVTVNGMTKTFTYRPGN